MIVDENRVVVAKGGVYPTSHQSWTIQQHLRSQTAAHKHQKHRTHKNDKERSTTTIIIIVKTTTTGNDHNKRDRF